MNRYVSIMEKATAILRNIDSNNGANELADRLDQLKEDIYSGRSREAAVGTDFILDKYTGSLKKYENVLSSDFITLMYNISEKMHEKWKEDIGCDKKNGCDKKPEVSRKSSIMDYISSDKTGIFDLSGINIKKIS